jgi:hypothetical protein
MLKAMLTQPRNIGNDLITRRLKLAEEWEQSVKLVPLYETANAD